MESFSTLNGDVIINKTIEMVNGPELLRQKVQRVMNTNKGEWSFDVEEGIDFSLILCKNPDKDEIRRTIEEALQHIDETFTVTSFNMDVTNRRKATIKFFATNNNGDEVGGEYSYGGN